MPDDELEQEMDEILEGMRANALHDLQNYMAAAAVMEDSEDVGQITLTMGDFTVDLPLVAVDVIADFMDFLKEAVEYYKRESHEGQ